MPDFIEDLKKFCRKHMIVLASALVIAIVIYMQAMTIISMTEFLEDHGLYDDYSNYNP